MIPLTAFAGQTIALFGLGSSGVMAAQALIAGGARVAAWDDNEASRAKAALTGVTLADLHDVDWSSFDALVLSPGVPLTHPAPHWSAVRAHAAKIPIIGDVELFGRQRAFLAPGARLVAITGTNGKSTTTALTAHLFREFGHDTGMGGNIGTPVLALEPPEPQRVYVVECSSYQIDLAPGLQASAGVLLNLTPDHLDRHGTMANYASVKERLVARADVAIVGIDDEHCAAIAARLDAAGQMVERISVAGSAVTQGITAAGTKLFRHRGSDSFEIADLAGIPSLRGAHNAQNAAAAILALGAEADDLPRLQAALQSFPGLAHRMEQVGRLGDVIFINDSKATNADATEKALLSFPRLFWILGGKAKAGGIESLRPYFPKIVKAYLIGEASEAFAATLGCDVPYELCGTLDVATQLAAEEASRTGREEAVVLSPACASFDQYSDFEKRGNHFKALVKGVTGARGR